MFEFYETYYMLYLYDVVPQNFHHIASKVAVQCSRTWMIVPTAVFGSPVTCFRSELSSSSGVAAASGMVQILRLKVLHRDD